MVLTVRPRRRAGREPNAYTLAGVAGSDAEQLPTCVE